MMEQYEENCFQIISYAGEARSYFIEALRHVKDEDKSKSMELLEEGNNSLILAEKAHLKFIQQEAEDKTVEMKMILMHAEDLMMSADTLKAIVSELIDLF